MGGQDEAEGQGWHFGHIPWISLISLWIFANMIKNGIAHTCAHICLYIFSSFSIRSASLHVTSDIHQRACCVISTQKGYKLFFSFFHILTRLSVCAELTAGASQSSLLELQANSTHLVILYFSPWNISKNDHICFLHFLCLSLCCIVEMRCQSVQIQPCHFTPGILVTFCTGLLSTPVNTWVYVLPLFSCFYFYFFYFEGIHSTEVHATPRVHIKTRSYLRKCI